MTDAILLAHVANAVEFLGLGQGYDEDADTAARLLAANPDLLVAADAFAQGSMGAADFEQAVRRASADDRGPAS